VHESLRPTGGRVIGEVRKPTVGRNHYTVDVQFDRTVRAALLLNPADAVDLTAGERRDIDYHRPSQLGQALFNWFD